MEQVETLFGVLKEKGEIGNFIGAKRAGLFLVSDNHIMVSVQQWTADASHSIEGLEGDIPFERFGYAADVLSRAEINIRQLSTALEQSPTPIIITDTESNILFVNHSFTDFSSMKPEEVIGTTPDNITRGQIRMGGNAQLWKTIRSGKVYRDEIQYTLKNEKQVWLSVTVFLYMMNRKRSHTMWSSLRRARRNQTA